MKIKIRIAIISLGIFLLCLATIGGVYFFKIHNNSDPIKEIIVEGNYAGYDSETKMSIAADLILYGSPVDNFEDSKHVNNYSDGILADFYTLTKFKIKNIIKKTAGLNIKKGNILDVLEPLTLIDDNNGKRILEIEGYKPMEKGTNYVIYLKKNDVGDYCVINMSNGRFNIDNDSDNMNSRHKAIKDDVLLRYSKEFSDSLGNN